MNNHDIELAETFDLLGIASSKHVILFHGNNEESIKRVHKETNKKILECLGNKSLGDCIHVTGEMRALKDPFHRYVCEEMKLREEGIFKVVFNAPNQEFANDPTALIKWNLLNWNVYNRKWQEDLRTIYSIANRSVRLYALDTSNEIQYSVFGNKFILLQERHRPGVSLKNTWLIENEKVNNKLLLQAKEKLAKSDVIDGGYYRRFTKNISGTVANYVLKKLLKSGKIEKEKILSDEFVNDFTSSPVEIIQGLNVIDFIDIDKNDFLSITKSGKEFLHGV